METGSCYSPLECGFEVFLDVTLAGECQGKIWIMILITAATGQVGWAALQALAGTGMQVRVFVCDPSKFKASEGVEVTQGDFDNEASIDNALKDVEIMFLAGRDSPDSVSQHRKVLGHVRHSSVRHVVKL